jgi:DNA-binding winged helix-turn-helix (wHTH) protein/tetratricopeptide (TPR) repeat protein
MLRRLHRFGDCTIDIAARELRQGDVRVDLSPRAFDCIAYLLEHRDRAVGRDELVAAVWGRTTLTDSLLGKTLVKARRAVGDSGEQQNVIRTVPRFGFHWVAEVQVEDIEDTEAPAPAPAAVAPAAPAPAQTTPAPAHRERTSSPRAPAWRWPALAAAAVALAIAAVLAAVLAVPGWRAALFRTAAPAQATGTPRIAVLPVTIAAGADDAWLRLGLMDLLAQRLRRAGLAVVPSDNIVRVVHGDVPPARAAALLREATGASAVVVATARRVDGAWLLVAELHGDAEREREVQARAADAVDAARLGADRLLALFGKQAPDDAEPPAERPLVEISQRAEAALLGNDFDTARRLIAAAPPALQATPELQLRLSSIDYRLGRSAEARSRLEKLLPALSAETEPVLRARALTGLAAIALKQNRVDLAIAPLDEAIGLLERHNDPTASGHAYTARGIAGAMQGRYADASRDFARGRIAFELAGDTHSLARIDINEAATDSMRDRPADALPLLERAAERFARLDTPSDLVNTLGNQIEAQLALLQSNAALATSERMMPLLGRIENPIERRIFLAIRAKALQAVGRLAETRALLGELLQSADAVQEAPVLGQARALQARLDLGIGQSGTAAVLARQALDGLGGAEYAHMRAEAWRTAVQALLRRGENTAALEESARFNAWADAAQRPALAALARLSHAEATPPERRAETDALYAEALRLADQAGVPDDVAAVATAYGNLLIARGELPRAAEVAGELARWADLDFDCALLQVSLYHALGREDAWRSSLERARALAGERPIAAELLTAPIAAAPDAGAASLSRR